MRLRDYTPRGYNARHILILIVPMIIFVVSMTLYFFYTHVQQVNKSLSRAVAEELAYVISERQRPTRRNGPRLSMAFAALASWRSGSRPASRHWRDRRAAIAAMNWAKN
jgi:hypothetical protein